MTSADLAVLLKPHIQQFIRDHESDDPYSLTLQGKRYPEIPIQRVAEQIQSRKKAKKKLPEWYRKEEIIFPPPLSMEQCSSETTARFKSSLVSGKEAVDLTGGVGVDAYYLSHSFEQLSYVEQNPQLAATARHNFRRLGTPSIKIYSAEAASFLSAMAPVDLIYLDPSRRDDAHQKVFRLTDCSPDVVSLLPTLLSKARQVMLKTSPMLDIDAALRDLRGVTQVYVVAVNSECKEVLYLLSAPAGLSSPDIIAVDLGTDVSPLKFTREEEANTPVTYAEPQQYVYEPHAAIMKAGAFRSVAQRWKVAKLHPHTHLYTSHELVRDFPGRSFRVEAELPYQKKAIRKLLPEEKANITTRNFTDSVATVRKKLGLTEGGEVYLFATRTQAKDRVLLIMRKVGIE